MWPIHSNLNNTTNINPIFATSCPYWVSTIYCSLPTLIKLHWWLLWLAITTTQLKSTSNKNITFITHKIYSIEYCCYCVLILILLRDFATHRVDWTRDIALRASHRFQQTRWVAQHAKNQYQKHKTTIFYIIVLFCCVELRFFVVLFFVGRYAYVSKSE